MIIISDTEEQAVQFLGMYKQELQDNEELISLFELYRNDKGEVEFDKDSSTDIIVRFKDGHRFRIMAKGAEQKVRGRLWDGTRPDIIICDDMENDELVMNKERRDKLRNWFKGAVEPSLSDHGIIRIVGTILHSDSLLENFMPNPSSKFTISTELKQWTNLPTKWKAVKYRAHNREFTKLLWPEKKQIDFFKQEYQEALRTGTTDTYSREYLNYPIDEAVSFFKRGDFLPITEADSDKTLNYYIAVDLAISENEKADYSVFVVAGVDENRFIHVKHVVRERLDGREIVDTLISLQRTFNPIVIGIEEMQISKSIGPFLNEAMREHNTYISLVKLRPHKTDKLYRARSIQARMRAHSVKFAKEEEWFFFFEQEMLTFPRGKHDDQVDAFAYLGLMLDVLLEAPSAKELEEEEYEDELQQSGLNYQGRSAITGY